MAAATPTKERTSVQIGNSTVLLLSSLMPLYTAKAMTTAILVAIPVYRKKSLGCLLFASFFIFGLINFLDLFNLCSHAARTCENCTWLDRKFIG